MATVARYGRWHAQFDPRRQATQVEFTGPDGALEVRPTFAHLPTELIYDEHGRETLRPRGGPVTAVRFTPTRVGRYRYRALAGEEVVAQGAFECESSEHPGYVGISARDPRYFAHSDGSPYCAIGLNLCSPAGDREGGTRGAESYRHRFARLSENGGNFARLWLAGNSTREGYFNAQTEVAGRLDLPTFARLDAVVELARQYGIHLKLCLEVARVTASGAFSFNLKSPKDGLPPADMDEWFRGEDWQQWWWQKVDAYLARYGDDPAVMAWELWNEINCCETSDWSVQREWTRRVLPMLKARTPRNLVTNSIGSFDTESYQSWYDDFRMDEMDFQQVHRYLDNGAPWDICHLDPPLFSADAVQRVRRPDRPVLLAETGAVRDRHAAAFPYYGDDRRGIVFHDCTYPAFFAGAAGTGHLWFWGYVDRNDLWRGYRPFADLVAGVKLDQERFRPLDLSTSTVWCYALLGKHHLLVWARNKADSWYHVLQDKQEPEALPAQQFDLHRFGLRSATVTTLRPWPDGTAEAKLVEGTLHLPPFRYGLLVKARSA